VCADEEFGQHIALRSAFAPAFHESHPGEEQRWTRQLLKDEAHAVNGIVERFDRVEGQRKLGAGAKPLHPSNSTQVIVLLRNRPYRRHPVVRPVLRSTTILK